MNTPKFMYRKYSSVPETTVVQWNFITQSIPILWHKMMEASTPWALRKQQWSFWQAEIVILLE